MIYDPTRPTHPRRPNPPNNPPPHPRRRDPDAWTLNDGRARYPLSAAVAPDPCLTALLVAACEREIGAGRVVQGLNATADGFYGSQGRTGGPFDDENEALIAELLAKRPELVSLEMETFMLLHLAACSGGSVLGTAMCIALAERYSNRWAVYSHLVVGRVWRAGGGDSVCCGHAMHDCSRHDYEPCKP